MVVEPQRPVQRTKTFIRGALGPGIKCVSQARTPGRAPGAATLAHFRKTGQDAMPAGQEFLSQSAQNADPRSGCELVRQRTVLVKANIALSRLHADSTRTGLAPCRSHVEIRRNLTPRRDDAKRSNTESRGH